MSAYQHWFISRQKRQLTQILPALICFSDICEGEIWRGNTALQLKFEDALAERSITKHGTLRARRVATGGGGIRTLFTQMKDLGLVFTEEDNGKAHLTLIAEELIKANITFVDAMRLQLSRFQYPSATRWDGSGAVDKTIKVHPFLFMFRLLRDSRLDGFITMDEMKLIIIHEAISDSNKCFNSVVNSILHFRNTGSNANGIKDTATGKYSDIANTFFNYIELTQYVDRGYARILTRAGKEGDIDNLIANPAKFIPHPEIQENYQRAYGVGTSTKDLRSFSDKKSFNRKELEEARIKSEYALLRLQTPIIGVDKEVIEAIAKKTGIKDNTIESFLLKNFPHGSIDDFFLTYKDYAYGGRKYATEFELATVEIFRKIFGMTAKHVGPIGNTPDVFVESDIERYCGIIDDFFLTYKDYAYGGRKYATEFELATVEIFRKIFGMTAKHVGPIGNTPDVFVESDIERYCGIIDNKAYENGYSVLGDHKRRMIDVYIPNVKEYADAKYPLKFFSYISTDFSKNINEQIKAITDETKINGSAMPVDLMIDFAQDYTTKKYSHRNVLEVFSINRKIGLADV